jgi:uracil-DNA glycosylase
MTTTPFLEGSSDAHILLVGEAPSFEEMRESRPFVGPAGKLLDLCLHSAKIARAECQITNVFETMVKKKDDDGAIYSRDGDLLWAKGKFTDAGHAASRGCLERIAASRANVIVPLGGVALSRVLDNRSVSKWRGSIVVNADGRKIVATIHPAFVIRGAYENRFLLISDLQKALAESASPQFTPTPRNIVIDPTFDQCIAALHRALDADAIDTDIEVLAGQVDCFSIATSPSEAISIPIVDAGFEHRWSAAEEAEIWTLYGRIIQSPRIAKINQNITFDLAALLELNNLIPCGPLHDPMIAHSIMYPALEKKLGVLCSLYTREPYYKDDGQLSDSPTVQDFARRWRYNALDSAVALECWQALASDIDADGYRATYDMTISLIPSLVYMMVHGIKVDLDALAVTRTKAQEDLKEIVARIEHAVGRSVITEAPKRAADKRAAAGALNINSPAQLMAYFYTEKKLKPYVNGVGRPTIDDKALTRIVRRDGLVEAKLLQDYRRLAKMIGTYLEMKFDRDGRMRFSANPRGTWTGRLSTSQTIHGIGGNVQNIPDTMAAFLVSDHAPA